MTKKYKRNYLDRVILKIDFDATEDDLHFKKYLSKLNDIFPYKAKGEGYEGMIEIDIKKDEVKKERKIINTWDYFDAYKNKKVTVTPGFIAIEYLNRSYKDSKELLSDCDKVIYEFIKELSISSIKRLGLRYINRFNLDEDFKDSIDWNTFFSKDLVSPINFSKKIRYSIVRSMSNLHLRLENQDILIRYGIWNQDFPSENTSKEFILDIDAFSRNSIDNPSEINTIIRRYNNDIKNIFEKSINSEIKKLLNKKR
jgi:uncharacterized protein (TIGR04255 family)